MNDWSNFIKRKGLHYFAIGIIGIGIIFRLILFFQNRNLIIDEANIVRNIYERNYIGLLSPLDYNQYAPPSFLWILESFSYLLGYSEMAMRLWPLLAGLCSLFVFWAMLKKLLPAYSLWISLGLFCFSPLLVKYAVEVKQYVPDTLIALSLLYLGLRNDILQLPRKKFILRWSLWGSIAIWSSQPSVFILSGISLYYLIQIAQQKQWRLFPSLIVIGMLWLGNFAIYYFSILQGQINSDYLQSYHEPYFLFALPHNAAEWRHNWLRIREILCNTGGYNMISLYSCALLLLIGAARLLLKNAARFALIAGPAILTILAAALHQFSLIDRVALFILPLLMTLVGYGIDFMFSFKKGLQYPAVFIGLYMLSLYNFGSLFYKRFEFHELTKGLDYILQKGGTGQSLYVDCSSRDTYIYYTHIHPDRNRYTALKGAYLFPWGADNFKEIAAAASTPYSFYIFTGGDSSLRARHIEEIKTSNRQIDYFEHAACFVYEFEQGH